MHERLRALVSRLEDARSRRVVFLAHCLLNENARYLGGACRRCCVRELVEGFLDEDVGVVQLPCPEERAWGGVLKRRLLSLYGSHRGRPYVSRLQRFLLPLALFHTRAVYRNLARRVAAQIADYLASGFDVVGVVGVDGSPSCGVARTLELQRSVQALASVDARTISSEQVNAIVRSHVRPGHGLFIAALQRALRLRGIDLPLVAHDLIAELEGRASSLPLLPLAGTTSEGHAPCSGHET